MYRKGVNSSFENGKKAIFVSIVILAIFGYLVDLFLYGSIYLDILIVIDYSAIAALLFILGLFIFSKKVSFKNLYIISSYIVVGSIVVANLFFINDVFSILEAQLYFMRGFMFCITVSSISGLLGYWKHLYIQMTVLMLSIVIMIFCYEYDFLLNNLLLLFTVSFGFGSVVSFFGFHINSFFNKIKNQNRSLEMKNNEVMDSIIYAKRIQGAILPSENKIKSIFPNLIFLYLAKDVVAGDFYFVEEFEDRKFFGVADATGHGVPGALVSIVCLSALSRVLREDRGKDTPDTVLNDTRKIIIEKLNENIENVNDGMDIGLCSIADNKLEFSGANISLMLVRDGKLTVFRGDRQPIGNYHTNDEYTLHSVTLEKGDMVYVTTDGYYDQFGEVSGKKFKIKRFKEFLLTIAHLSIKEQKIALRNEFYDWKGGYDQIDDVCLLIFKHE